jgi:hypothetical protein
MGTSEREHKPDWRQVDLKKKQTFNNNNKKNRFKSRQRTQIGLYLKNIYK